MNGRVIGQLHHVVKTCSRFHCDCHGAAPRPVLGEQASSNRRFPHPAANLNFHLETCAKQPSLLGRHHQLVSTTHTPTNSARAEQMPERLRISRIG